MIDKTTEPVRAESARLAVNNDDAVMLVSLGILAYVASMMTHEAFGHGAFCIASGGYNVMLSGWAEGCNLHPEPMRIAAAGPAVQFCAGLSAWFALRRLAAGSFGVLRSFLFLYMAFNLFISSGYVALSGVTGFGDSAVIIAGRLPHSLWRGILVLIGAVVYYLSMWAAVLELRRIIGSNNGYRRLRRFLWIPYLAAGALACCAGALNRTMAPGLALELAVASSFGAGLGLVCLPYLQCGVATTAPIPEPHIKRRIAWIIAATVIGAAFVFVLGPGLGEQWQ